MSEHEPTIADVLSAIDKMRIDLMARMDRLQDTATTQGRDMEALLDLMVTTQKIA
jgi:hypothetical protein